MRALTLQDLKPQSATFHLRKYDRDFTIRTLTLADEAWLQNTFGKDLDEKMKSLEGMCRLVFRLMSEPDKAIFAPQTREAIDEDGNKQTEVLGGWRLFMEAVESMSEKVMVSRALLQTRGISSPIIDEVIGEELKKKELMERLESSAGEASSTSSHPSTDGPGTISGPSLEETSRSP